MARWSRFPKQIAAGLRAHYHGAHIRQWHTGEMSSRELLELLDGMPEESEYKRALDGYPFGVERDWTRAEYLAARSVAEAAAARGGAFDPTGLVSPVEQAVSTMRSKGEYPPAWWSEKDRAIALKAMAADRAAEPVTSEATRQRVSSIVSQQLHRKD